MEIRTMPQGLNPFYNPGPGDVIRDAMEELGWNQADLAEVTGLTQKSVNLIINNKQAITPETATLLGLISLLTINRLLLPKRQLYWERPFALRQRCG